MAKVSIITVCYNNLEGLKRTYASIVNQTARKEIGWIVVDGASTDGTPEWLEAHSAEIDRWVSEPDSGIYNAMNKGVRMATGEYCLFINSGDLLNSDDIIEKCIPHLDGTIIIYGDLVTYNPKNGIYGLNKYPRDLRASYFINGTLPHQATFILTTEIKNNPYSEKYRIVSDWLFFAEQIILRNASYKYINEKIGVFYLDGISIKRYGEAVKETKAAWHDTFPECLTSDLLELVHAKRLPFYSVINKIAFYRRKLISGHKN